MTSSISERAPSSSPMALNSSARSSLVCNGSSESSGKSRLRSAGESSRSSESESRLVGMDCWLASGRCAGCSGSNSRSSSRGSSSLSCPAVPAASSGRACTSRSACARTGSGCVGSGRTTGGGSGCCSMGARAGRSTVSSAVRRASWSAAFWRMTRVSSGLPGPAGCTESTVFCRRWPRR